MTQGEMALTQAVTGTAGGPAGMFTDPKAVSYTHLTLPTILHV